MTRKREITAARKTYRNEDGKTYVLLDAAEERTESILPQICVKGSLFLQSQEEIVKQELNHFRKNLHE